VIPLRDRNPTSRTPFITVLLIAVNIGVFVLLQGGGTASDQQQVEFTYERAAVPCEIVQQRPLTFQEINREVCEDVKPRDSLPAFPDKNVDLAIVVSMFLHASWIHLLGNMLFLWIFGNNIEDKIGPFLYLAFYLAGGFVATAAQMATDTTSTVPLVGASGAIAAVMGAYIVLFPRARILTWIAFLLIVVVEVPAWIVLGFWFGSQFFTQEGSGVAWMAHVGGFVFGVGVAMLANNSRWWLRRSIPKGTQISGW
jgi:membrane associated rhomboid family serine protease